ncbi:MAG: ParA family protein [Candidatus Heimdallarchaeota archaeon]|nr:ParA family protein [Candidatus Heimdallarchaeota archaeon]
MKSLGIHSNKGGVGKTTIALNAAVLLAQQGHNVALLDFDFGGPNLYTFFETLKIKKYLNDHFWGSAKSDEVIYHVNDALGLKSGNLFVGFANPSHESTVASIELDSKDAMKMLQSSMIMKSSLTNAPYKCDYLIIDTTPGIALTTINSFINSDIIMFIVKFSNADIEGTIHTISGLVDSLSSEATIISNNVPAKFLKDKELCVEVEKAVVKEVRDKTDMGARFLGWIERDENLLDAEFLSAVKNLRGEKTKRVIHAIDQPDSPIVFSLKGILGRVW